MSENTTEQATATEASDNTTTETTETTPPPTETVEFWKAKAREQEKRAKENAAAAKRVKEIEDASKSEQERATERATAAEQRAQELGEKYTGLLKRQAISDAATTAQAVSVNAVIALVSDQVDVGDDGTVTGADEAIKALMKSDPALFKTSPGGTRDAAAGRTPVALNSDALEESLRRAVGA